MTRIRLSKLTPLVMAAFIASPAAVYATTTTGEASSARLTPKQITQAIQANTLQQLLSNAIGTPASDAGIANLKAFLTDLASSNPALVAKTANALASLAWDTAPDDPAGALRLAQLALSAIDDPKTIAAAPADVGQTVITLAGAHRLAVRSAATKDIELVGADELADRIQALAGNATIVAAIPDIQSKIDESIQLADAQADLAGFTTAAGPGDLGDALGTQGFSEFETAIGAQQDASPTEL